MPGLFSWKNLVLCDMQGNYYGLLMKTIKKFPKSLFGQLEGFSLLTGTKFAVRRIELLFTLQHDREIVMFRLYFPLFIKLCMVLLCVILKRVIFTRGIYARRFEYSCMRCLCSTGNNRCSDKNCERDY